MNPDSLLSPDQNIQSPQQEQQPEQHDVTSSDITFPTSIEIDSSQFSQMMVRLEDIQTVSHNDVLVFGNLLLGILIGYIAIRGLLNPWNRSS